MSFWWKSDLNGEELLAGMGSRPGGAAQAGEFPAIGFERLLKAALRLGYLREAGMLRTVGGMVIWCLCISWVFVC